MQIENNIRAIRFLILGSMLLELCFISLFYLNHTIMKTNIKNKLNNGSYLIIVHADHVVIVD